MRIGRWLRRGDGAVFHNNSVPTLYHLLLPADQRPGTFPVGHREFDPVKLGYTTDRPGTPTFLFDTTRPGNGNAGHTGRSTAPT